MRILSLLCLFIPSLLLAQVAEDELQNNAYRQGDHVLQIGIGYPNAAAQTVSALKVLPDDLLSSFIVKDGKAGPQFNIAYDFGLTKQISVGPYFGYASASSPTFGWDDSGVNIPFVGTIDLGGGSGQYGYKVKIYSFGLKAVYHIPQLSSEKLDVYAMGFLGTNLVKMEEQGDFPEDNALQQIIGFIGIGAGNLIPVPEVSDFSYSGNVGARYFIKHNLGIYLEVGYGSNILNGGLSWKFSEKKNEE